MRIEKDTIIFEYSDLYGLSEPMQQALREHCGTNISPERCLSDAVNSVLQAAKDSAISNDLPGFKQLALSVAFSSEDCKVMAKNCIADAREAVGLPRNFEAPPPISFFSKITNFFLGK